MPPDKKKKKRRQRWTVFYTIGNEIRVFRAMIQTTSAEDAVRSVEEIHGPVNHAIAYKGKLGEPAHDTF